jgi:hypothetical protein
LSTGGYWLYRSFSQAIHGLLQGENQVHPPGEPLIDFQKPLKANTHLYFISFYSTLMVAVF